MVGLPLESSAVTVKVKDVPTAAVDGALTRKRKAAAEVTLIGSLVPVIELSAVSVAVSVWSPTVFNVTLNEPTPPIRLASAGKTAAVSVLLK